MANKMVYKSVTFSANVKKPKVGDSFCDWGIDNKLGFSCVPIKEITKSHIILKSNEKVRLNSYYAKEVMNKPKRKCVVR